MDPTDFLDYVSEMENLLESGETIIAGFTVSPTTEGAALGFEISSSPPPSLEAGSKNILYWTQVNGANQQDAVYDDDGTSIPVEVTITTSLTRRFQRTFLITVKQL